MNVKNINLTAKIPKKRNLASIVICARKRKGFTQQEVVSTLGIVQSTLSRIERGELIPSIYLWMGLADLLEIPLNSLRHGYLDMQTDSAIISSQYENGFKLSIKYSKERCIKVRFLLPFFEFIKASFSEKMVNDLLTPFEIDLNFFNSLDNQVNLTFLYDLIIAIKKLTNSETSDIFKNITAFIKTPETHGDLASIYNKSNSIISLLNTFIIYQKKYQSAFLYTITDKTENKITFMLQRNPLLNNKSVKNHIDATEYLEQIIPLTLHQFTSYDHMFQHSTTLEKQLSDNSTDQKVIFSLMI